MERHTPIAGESVVFRWTQGASRKMRLRLSEIGFDWKKDTRGAKFYAALFKIAWALLPDDVFARYATHEEMFAAMSDEEEAGLIESVTAICAEMGEATEQKKTSSAS